MSTTESNNKRIAKNTLYLYVRMFIMMLISLYTSRITLSVLGVVDYGVNNVVGGVIAMLGFITSSLGGATSRFITFDLGCGDMEQLKKTFGNILSMYLFLAVLILIVGETLGLWFMTTQLQIPVDRQGAAFWVYQLSIFSTMLGVISAPYNSVIIAHERMSAFAYISILDVVLKLLIVYLLVVIPYDKLITIAILSFCVQTIDRIVYGVYCSRHFDEVHTRLRFDKKQFLSILSFAGWTMNGCLACVCYTQGLNILLNMFFGPVVNAARGIAVQVQNVCNQFCSNFLLAVKPQLIKSYAQGDLPYMHQLLLKSSKFAFYILFFIALPLSLEANQVLNWWLVEVPDHTANFLRLVLCTAILRAMASPVINAVHATGHLRKFQIVEGTILLMALPIAYPLFKFFDIPPEVGFAVVVFVELVAQYARVRIVLPMIKLRLMAYFTKVVVPIVLVAVVASVIPLIVYYLLEPGIASFFIVCTVCVISCSLTIYTLGCTSGERRLVIEKVNEYYRKWIR